MAAVSTVVAAPAASASPPARSADRRIGYLAIGALALAVRVAYVLAFKHPVSIGGDAYYYHYGANLLVKGYGFIDAYRFHNGLIAPTADHPPGTILVLAAASLLGMRSFFWHQLEMCLLGSATVVVVAVIARQLAGWRAAVIAGIIGALYPNLWFNDAMVMSETLVQLTTALAVLAAYRWWATPTRTRAVVLGAAIGVCSLARAEAALFVPLLLVPLILFDRRAAVRERLLQTVLCGLSVGIVLAPWVGYNMSRFAEPVTISSGFDPTVTVSNCDKVFYGELTGYWWRQCILDLPAPTKGDIPGIEAQYRKAAFHYISTHKSRVPTVVAARILRTWGLFRPIQQIRLDTFETREIRFSEFGLGMYAALAVATLAAVAALRRRRIPVSPILATVGTVTFATAITFGQTRYRASAEVVLVLGAALASAVMLARWLGPDPDGGPALAELPAPPPPPPAPTRAFFPCLDGLRAVAAITVIGVHTAFRSGLSGHSPHLGRFTARLEVGVWVFFLLSGFLIYRPFAAAHLEGRPGPAVGAYLRRRMLRIVPAYWVALGAAALLGVVDHVHSFHDVVIYFGFLQIYDTQRILHGIPAAWTLCIEMSFYLLLPLYAAAVARGRRAPLRAEITGIVALVIASEAWKVAIYWGRPNPHNIQGSWLPAYLDLFAIGMGIAVWSARRPRVAEQPAFFRHRAFPWLAWGFAAACFWGVSVPLGLPISPAFSEGLGKTMGRHLLYGGVALGLLLPAVFGAQDQGWIRTFLRLRVVAFLGLLSYGIYLWHETVINLVFRWRHRPLFGISFSVLTTLTLVGSVAVAALSYMAIERPFMQLRLRKAREGHAVPEPATAR
ncbi:MAG: hypothetical protein NVSMB12_02970 [Acidimicrobiales bacterium]